MNMIKKTIVTSLAIATVSIAALSVSVSGASAGGWKKHHKHHHNFHKGWHKPYHYNYNYGYSCKPKFRRIWVWSPYHGRKIKRLVKVGEWCGGRYIDLY